MAEKARTPMSGAEREAKYAAKMKEKDHETWCAKNREKMRKCIENMSDQKLKEMRRRDAERKREKRAAEKLKRPCFLWRKTPSWHKECPPYGGLLRSCFVKVQPFKGATTSKEHRL